MGIELTDAQKRRLLELAALGAGYEISQKLQQERDDAGYGHVGLYIRNYHTCWNPIQSDADVFHLAVLLQISIQHGIEILDDTKQLSAYAYIESGWCAVVPHGDDKYAATRLAIVCAAAAIGRKKLKLPDIIRYR